MDGLSCIGRNLEVHLVFVVYIPYWLKIMAMFNSPSFAEVNLNTGVATLTHAV